MSRAVIYARYSSVNQTSETIEVQISVCTDYCERVGDQVVGHYVDEARSGTTEHGRDEYLRMLEEAKSKKFDKVLIYKWDRFGRSMADTATAIRDLERLDISVESVTETSDRGSRGFMIAAAEMLSQRISENTRDAMAAATRKGRRLARAPFGYRKHDGNLAIEPEEAKIVREIFAHYLSGRGTRWIAGYLNESGARPPRSDIWNPTSVRWIITNRTYAGDTIWNSSKAKFSSTGGRYHVPRPEEEWIVVEDTHDPIVERADWLQANASIDARTLARPGRLPRSRFLLSGMLMCGACGHPYQMRQNKGRKARYRCGFRYRHGDQMCDNSVNVIKDQIEPWVLSILQEFITEGALLTAAAEARKEIKRLQGSTDGKRIQREIRSLEKSSRNLVTAISSGKRIQVLVDELDAVERKRNNLQEELEGIHDGGKRLPTEAEIRRLVEDFHLAVRSEDVSDLRGYLAKTMESIIVYPDGLVVAKTLTGEQTFEMESMPPRKWPVD